MSFHIVLVNPEIPPNTGNIIRLSANTGSTLHLVRPLGFKLEDKLLRRAGLDYHLYADVQVHADLPTAFVSCGQGRRFAISADGLSRYDTPKFTAGDIFVFGCESIGLSETIKQEFRHDKILSIPMYPHNRSLNLSNAVAIVVMEAWRQQNFAGAEKQVQSLN